MLPVEGWGLASWLGAEGWGVGGAVPVLFVAQDLAHSWHLAEHRVSLAVCKAKGTECPLLSPVPGPHQ